MNNSKLYLKEIGLECEEWICLVQDRDKLRTFGFHKMWEISWSAEKLSVPQEIYFTDFIKEECLLQIYSNEKPVHGTLNSCAD
jgi:hypothetical protein